LLYAYSRNGPEILALDQRKDETPNGLHCQGEAPVVAAIGKFSCLEVTGQPLRDLYTA
jgi:hypothetical protein